VVAIRERAAALWLCAGLDCVGLEGGDGQGSERAEGCDAVV
jgi:hypothetical protein